MKRLAALQRELAKFFAVPEPREKGYRRKRLSKKDIAAMALAGFFEYLGDRLDMQDTPAAEKLYEEVRNMPEDRLAEDMLSSLEKLLVENHPRGQRIFTFLRNRAPERLGRAYAILRLFQDTSWVLEDLEEDYDYYRRNS
jgi:hypothetical protein